MGPAAALLLLLQRFQTLVALMLSSQTKDEVTFAAMQRLIAHGCTAEGASLVHNIGLDVANYEKETCPPTLQPLQRRPQRR